MTSDGWQDVLDANGNAEPRREVRLRPGALGGDQVSVTLEVAANADGPIEFGDNLYGATAWARDGAGAWRRVDTADFRLMIMMSLPPGGSADVTLPLTGDLTGVRVLVNGAWADVTR
ncbi:MAG TPA: hypothetical protein VGD67_01060 [Pseudonocardiaceae bacterium]